jgi:amino-acid N-acetyltransferase
MPVPPGRKASRLVAAPLAVAERDGLATALAKAGLPADDVREAGRLFWRFQADDMPVGFGGLEVHGDAALLHSVLTLPPLRRRGFGRAIVRALELEIPPHCRAVYLLTPDAAFFEPLGYARLDPGKAPRAIKAAKHFAKRPRGAVLMTKRLG